MLILIILLLCSTNFLNVSSCPNGSIASRDSTKCYYFAKEKVNWMLADQSCRTLDGNLVSIHDMFENMFISGESYRFFTESTENDFWIGANDIQTINNWSWTDNTSFDFSSWDKGQPQNNSGPLCVSSMINGARWNANDCFIAKPYICELKVPMCSEGWTYFESTNFCYKLIQHDATWTEAELSCKNLNAHLASLHSYDEALFVTYLASNITSRNGDTCDDYYQTWIGLSTPDNNTKWDWTDGTPFDYKNWGLTEPDLPGKQNCVIMWTRQPCTYGWDATPTEWDNLQCNVKILNNVCKKATSV